ncbi:MAG: hypothetical protein AB1393_13630 [Candidatus Edwardsbacteria bacterium]
MNKRHNLLILSVVILALLGSAKCSLHRVSTYRQCVETYQKALAKGDSSKIRTLLAPSESPWLDVSFMKEQYKNISFKHLSDSVDGKMAKLTYERKKGKSIDTVNFYCQDNGKEIKIIQFYEWAIRNWPEVESRNWVYYCDPTLRIDMANVAKMDSNYDKLSAFLGLKEKRPKAKFALCANKKQVGELVEYPRAVEGITLNEALHRI